MSEDLNDLDKRIREAEANTAAEKIKEERKPESNEGMRAASEFLGYIIGGAFFGYAADRYLDTAPWGLIILCVGGLIMAVYRANKAMNKS